MITRTYASKTLALLFAFALPACEAAGQRRHPARRSISTQSGARIFDYAQQRTVVVEFHTAPVFVYNSQNRQTLAAVGQARNFVAVVNATYFHRDQTHAGWLSIGSERLAPWRDDRQLSDVVIVHRATRDAHVVRASAFDRTTAPDELRFQTGPRVADRGTLDVQSIRESINGEGRYERTLFGFADKTFYLIVCRTPITLTALGAFLLKHTVLAGTKATIVNLDGGPSTALWLRDHPRLNFRQSATLPILIGVP